MKTFNLNHKQLFKKEIICLLFLFSFNLYAIDIPDTKDIKSFESLKFTGVHEQGADKSCGFSVVSSILNLYLGHNVNEDILISKFFKDLQKTKEMSMAQMIKVFKLYGYKSKAYKVNTPNLIKAVKIYAPVIVHYNKPDMHFVFILYADDKHVITADPVSGIEIQDVSVFEKRWSGFMLLIKISPEKLNKDLLNKTIKYVIEKNRLLEKSASGI